MSHPVSPHLITQSVERAVLVVILLIVGGLAGLASFTHVHDWTMDNSPAGTPHRFGWTNAAISELVPIAALLVVRQRRRTGGSTIYPMILLIGAISLSLAAQIAVAKPGVSGWLLSAVPALAFMGLSKLVLSGGMRPTPVLTDKVEATPMEPAIALEPPSPASSESDRSATSKTTADDMKLATRARPKSLTSAAKVAAIAARMPDAKPAEIAAKAGVSESTVRRYTPRRDGVLASPTGQLRAETAASTA